MNRFLINSVDGSQQHIVTDAISEAGKEQRVYFAGSFADCWAWIQYQEYNQIDARTVAHRRKK